MRLAARAIRTDGGAFGIRPDRRRRTPLAGRAPRGCLTVIVYVGGGELARGGGGKALKMQEINC